METTAPSNCGPCERRRRSFTLIELMVATAILSILLLLILSVLDQTQRSWGASKSRVSQFRDARVAFELISRNLSQATLNTYWDYRYPNGTNIPTGIEPPERYVRQSELQFLTGIASSTDLIGTRGGADVFPGHAMFFQAPLGYSEDVRYKNLGNLLCGRGYFVRFGDDSDQRPPFIDPTVVPLKYRFRLYEFRPPTENNAIYGMGLGSDGKPLYGPPKFAEGRRWYDANETWAYGGSRGVPPKQSTRPIADNIICLIISPRKSTEDAGTAGDEPYSIAPQYQFNSVEEVNPGMTVSAGSQGIQHLLPPLVQVTMVAIDDVSAIRLADEHGTAAPGEITGFLSTHFQDVAEYDDDIGELEGLMNSLNINYRIFSATVAIRASKWNGKF